MTLELGGLHHVTAIAGDPQRNLEFYAGLLGLPLVKRTVNFDDPGTYHFYFGDALGTPGSLLTFFPWPGARPGRAGSGQATAVSCSVPAAALDFWARRLEGAGVSVARTRRAHDDTLLSFADPDGLALELIGDQGADTRAPWNAGPVPAAHAIRGLYGVTLSVGDLDRSAEMLTGTLRFRAGVEAGGRARFEAAAGGPGTVVDVVAKPGAPRGLMGAGAIHHVAWRTPGDETQRAWRETLVAGGHHVTEIQDRRYFRSIYFHEPGGVLFEIATDGPGMTADEPAEALGATLKLPPWLEPLRQRLERALPAIQVPAGGRS